MALVVGDDPRFASFLDRSLTVAGYRVEHFQDGMALAALDVDKVSPDVLVLDLDLPGSDALGVARHLRACTSAPLLMLSECDAIERRVAALDAGADDYLSKPVALEELLARLHALRRGRQLAAQGTGARARQGYLTYADVRLNLDTREAVRGARRLELRHKGFELLAYFLRHPHRVLSRGELLEGVWGYEFLGDSNVIDVTISHLRQALEADGERRLIQTVRPVGYMLNLR